MKKIYFKFMPVALMLMVLNLGVAYNWDKHPKHKSTTAIAKTINEANEAGIAAGAIATTLIAITWPLALPLALVDLIIGILLNEK